MFERKIYKIRILNRIKYIYLGTNGYLFCFEFRYILLKIHHPIVSC